MEQYTKKLARKHGNECHPNSQGEGDMAYNVGQYGGVACDVSLSCRGRRDQGAANRSSGIVSAMSRERWMCWRIARSA